MEYLIFGVLSLLVILIYYLKNNSSSNTKELVRLQSTITSLEAKNAVLTSITPNIDNYVSKDIYYKVIGDLQATVESLQEGIERYIKDNIELTQKLELLNHAKKSSEVKLGKISEHLVPFVTDFPYDVDNLRALFQPIDYICFNDDEIVFIEVKTGNSSLSTKQRAIRDLIRDKKVRFEIYRLKGEK